MNVYGHGVGLGPDSTPCDSTELKENVTFGNGGKERVVIIVGLFSEAIRLTLKVNIVRRGANPTRTASTFYVGCTRTTTVVYICREAVLFRYECLPEEVALQCPERSVNRTLSINISRVVFRGALDSGLLRWRTAVPFVAYIYERVLPEVGCKGWCR